MTLPSGSSAMSPMATPASTRAIESGTPIRVLIAEDETHLGTILEQFLTARGFSVRIVRDGRAALEQLRTENFDVALLDVVMPEVDGLEVLRLIREEPLPPEVIVITGNGTIETAIAALKLGAYDFLSKPYRMAEIEALVRRAWEKRMLARDNMHMASRLQRAMPSTSFVTHFAPLVAVLSMVEKIAPSPSPVLISGESGTGKDVIARLLHTGSARAEGPFVDLNCAAIAESLMERELFGVEKGAFPGAEQRRIGLFELAAGGTLYLDNVGDLDLKVQGKLLRALESGTFYRVGGAQKVEVDVRVVASSTRDLSRMVQAGTFRDDLLHRINTIRIVLPPLRERAVDVPLLAQHFLGTFANTRALRLTDEAIGALERYRWPGNVRELRNVMERAALLATNGVVEATDLPLGADVGAGARPTSASVLSLGELEQRHIADVLERTNWHQGRAAEMLGISPKTLYRKIREYGFKRPSGRNA
ncbi:sigma-54-dependent transcriptional regulator [Gemmatimonas sp.]|jgi:DNA-binding NtrC family response regulator|uniref:sigma-54-dependent transcriptional regulator n=1 Tax=Gemmatimonas sp. TaxID=1962908 RepID=UPI0037C139AF